MKPRPPTWISSRITIWPKADQPVAVSRSTRPVTQEEETAVNSFHHQAVKDLGAGLKASAHAFDGIVEGFQAVDYPFVVGVQWHPEQEINADKHAVLPIFKRLVDACR